MAFAVQTLDEFHAFVIALFKGVFPDGDISQESFNWKWHRVLAGAVTDNHAHIDAVMADLMPDTASKDALTRWAALRGVARKGATVARKADALRIFGTEAATVAEGTELVHSSGLRFAINQPVTIPAAGYYDADVVAIDTGSATRLNAGEQLRFTSVPTDIEEEAELQIDIDEDGDDAEADGALRLRVLERFAAPPLGGARVDYEYWAKQVTGIAAAHAYAIRRGVGTVDVAALHAGSGTARILTEGERGELAAYLDERKPVGVDLLVLTVVPEAHEIDVAIVTNGEPEFAFDWDDSTIPIVLSAVEATRLVTFTLARPDTMRAGDRVCFRPYTTGLGTGETVVIERLDGTDAIVIERWLTGIEVGSECYSGGPLTEPCREALLALIDGLGTSNPDDTRYGPWNGTLRIGAMLRAVNSLTGVLDAEVVTPPGNLEPTESAYPAATYPVDDTVGLIVPGHVLVRRKNF